MASSSTKRKVLTIKDKVRIISAYEGGKKIVDLCREFGLVNSTVGSIIKNKEKILRTFKEDGENMKRIRKCDKEEVDSALLKWFKQCRSANIPVSGPILKEKATEFGKLFDLNFTCSNGWLDRFKARHSISFAKICGEAKCVDENITSDWLQNTWPVLRQSFKDEDIFNGDETGVFYKLTPDKTLQFKNEKCVGGKLSKERITAFVCANMSGTEKRKLLVIGKSMKPRCFRNVTKLPVNYTANKKAWMTSAIFEEELRKWDKELLLKKRKILLVVDNCAAHPKLNFTNIDLVFLPANCTSVLQPMDQGVIRSLKCHYRKQLIQKMIICMDSKQSIKISVLDAIQFLDSAWKNVTSTTNSKCFKKSGLDKEENKKIRESGLDEEENLSDDEEDDLPLSEWAKKLHVDPNEIGVNFDLDSYATVDDQAQTFQMVSEEEIVEEVKNVEAPGSDEDELDQEDDIIFPTTKEAVSAVETLSRYFRFKEVSDTTLIAVQHLLTTTQEMYFSERTVQKKITDFFSK